MTENENCHALLSASKVKGHLFQHLSLTGGSRDQREQSKSIREADQGEENTLARLLGSQVPVKL